MNDRPLVSIGLPVYNGGQHLADALRSLLAQDYENYELLVSDNASTDDTQALCLQLAASHPHVRYVRNPVNVGPIANFNLVLERARGKYFMWAAHDDGWNPGFVSKLVAQLETYPAAVLATPAILHTNEDGSLRGDELDRPARGETLADNFRQLLADHAPSWIYGVWNTVWLRRYLCELDQYPLWGGDVLWLADVALREKIVGSQDALLFKRHRRSRYAPRTARQQAAFWAYMAWHLTRICQRRVPHFAVRLRLMAASWNYVYRLCIRRSNLLRTIWRVERTLGLAACELVWASCIAGCSSIRRLFKPRCQSERAVLPLGNVEKTNRESDSAPARRSA